jgi:hypothetical protein
MIRKIYKNIGLPRFYVKYNLDKIFPTLPFQSEDPENSVDKNFYDSKFWMFFLTISEA